MTLMLVRMASVMVATLSADAQIAAGESAPEPSARSIAGQVIDAENLPVVDAAVLLCEQSSGIPLMSKTFQRISDVLLAGSTDIGGVAYRKTDEKGRFRFEGVPAGRYRLVAQSWPDVQPVDSLLEMMVKEVHLCGIAADVTVTDDASPEVVIRPLGTGTLRIDDNLSRDGVLVAFSRAPTRADRALGFVGWGGEFARHLIGWNRKLDGPMTVSGLPEGTVYVGLCGFVADDMSGWGAGKAVVKTEQTTEVTIPIHSVWAGHHGPPKTLQPLFDEIKSMGSHGFQAMLLANQLKPPRTLGMQGFWERAEFMSRHLDRELVLPSGNKAPFADVMAVALYLRTEQLRERGEK